ncbi:hypothetical protein [Lysinibacillus sphaericus]|uniref:hypothetical protein n=1 Tax=Lysinibacillus sphaericus TaxID=1421 RepID=UPI001F513130|nr:hypothetical protein [Lysinibacillus sphaericus]
MIRNEKELKTKLNQLISDSDFLRLQESFEKQSLFQLLGFGHRETMHSSFISWLLSPTSSLNLGTFPQKRFSTIFARRMYQMRKPLLILI